MDNIIMLTLVDGDPCAFKSWEALEETLDMNFSHLGKLTVSQRFVSRVYYINGVPTASAKLVRVFDRPNHL